MSLDAPLVAAATLRRMHGRDPRQCAASDVTHQLQLAHVLLDGGYDGVATLGEALAHGDHGLGTVDRLDGELVVVDGEPWRVDWKGRATLMPPETRTPFAVVATLDRPRTARLRDVDREGVVAAVADLADDPGAVVAVRLEGSFREVLVRSVPPQDPPYRPYSEVCLTDEVRWEHKPFYGVFVGFSFPDLGSRDTIPGLHLHGLDRLRTTGGHNYQLQVKDAVLSVGTSHDVVMALPERTMADLLETPEPMRAVQRELLRSGPLSAAELASALDIDEAEARARLDWLADRGFIEREKPGPGAPAGSGSQAAEVAAGAESEPGTPQRWATSLRAPGSRVSSRASTLLDLL